MAVRKTVEETFVVDGDRAGWLPKVRAALHDGGFKNVNVSEALYELSADYKKATTWGKLVVTLEPDGDTRTRIRSSATANVDNIFAAFKSPGKKIIERFKSGLR